jgi:hypothetical protein
MNARNVRSRAGVVPDRLPMGWIMVSNAITLHRLQNSKRAEIRSLHVYTVLNQKVGNVRRAARRGGSLGVKSCSVICVGFNQSISLEPQGNMCPIKTDRQC